MAIAARKPQVSSPIDTIAIIDTFDFEDVSFAFDVWVPTSCADEIDTEIVYWALGTAVFTEVADEVTFEDQLFHFYLNNTEYYGELDFEFIHNYTEQLIPQKEGVDSSDAVGRLDNLELDFARSSTNPSYFKEFNYIGGALFGYSIYTDASKLEKIYEVAFSFSGEDLSTKTITRILDNKTLSVLFTYSDGNLVSQTRVIQ